MKNSYLGNNHDYVKFALLRHIRRKTGLSIGVNWYFNPEDPNSPDDRKTPWPFLSNLGWKCLAPCLLERLHKFTNPKNREIKRFRKMDILPGDTRYFEEPITEKNRSGWHERAKKSCLKKAGLIFLDPSTGFEPLKSKSTERHALYSEAVDWLRKGKHVVTYQVATREKGATVIKQAKAVRAKLHRCAKAHHVAVTAPAPVILGRSSPNVLLVTISPKGEAVKTKKLNAALESFAPQICNHKDCKTEKCTRKKCKIKLVRKAGSSPGTGN